jgi:hypothetical protein
MSESLAFVRKLFESDKTLLRAQSKKRPTHVVREENGFVQEYSGYPYSVTAPQLISSASPHPHSQALVVLLNVVFCRFLEILRKQIYLANIFAHRDTVGEFSWILFCFSRFVTLCNPCS